MPLGQTQQQLNKIYLNINRGQVERALGGGRKEFYSFVEGRLVSIFEKVRDFHGEKVIYWYIDLQDESGEVYSIGFHHNSGVLVSIINSMASAEALSSSSVIRISPYERNGFTKVSVYCNGEKLDWKIKELPPIEEVKTANGKVFKDDSKRMEILSGLAQEIRERIS